MPDRPGTLPTRGPSTERSEMLLVAGLSIGLIGYVYVIGWATTCVRLAAVGLPVAYSLPGIGSDAVFATGARAVLVMAIVFAAMCVFAYLLNFRRWDRHAEAWQEIVATNRAEARERYLKRKRLKPNHPKPVRLHPEPPSQEALVRLVAGFNVGVLAVALGLVGGRLLKTPVDQLWPGRWWTLLAPWALCSTLAAWLLGRVNPLRGGRVAHALLWLAVIGVAMVSSAPVGLLVLTWAGIGTLGRQLGGRPLPGSPLSFVRSPLPWALLTIYALVALSYAAMPPLGLSQTIALTASGRSVGGYVGRSGSSVYLALCTPLADATSTGERVQAIPASSITSLAATGVDFSLDTGYRPSLPTLLLHALGFEAQTVAWVRPEVKEPHAPCAGTPPPRPGTASEAPQLGPGVYTSPAPPSGRAHDGEPTIEQEAKAPRIAALAERFQPTVLTSVSDPFWPVSIGAVLEDVGSDGRQTCVRHGSRGPRCAAGAHATLAELRASRGAADDFLEYPVTPALTSQPTPQLEAFLRGQLEREGSIPSRHQTLADPGVLDPWATAQVYFYYAGPASRLHWPVAYPAKEETGLVALEYWFFYPYNYLPTVLRASLMEDAPIAADAANTDLHQGDWEHVVVLVAPGSGEARWLYTARHANEGKFIPWSSTTVTRDGEHPIVQAAYGGHPSYPAGCGARPRYLKPINGRLSDWLVCGPDRFAFRGSSTPLVDLAGTGWACWKGHFGAPSRQSVQTAAQSTNAIFKTLGRELENNYYVAGPRSPLWQGENGHLEGTNGESESAPSGPCAGAAGPTGPEREAERQGAGRPAVRRGH
jgi:Vacuolar protein sorting-associated protein 62